MKRIKSIKLITLAGCIILCFALYSPSLEGAIEILSDNIGGYYVGYVMIPYSELFAQHTGEGQASDNYFSVSFITLDDDIVFQQEFNISVSFDEESVREEDRFTPEREYYPVKIETKLSPGRYRAVFILTSQGSGQRRTYRNTFIHPSRQKKAGSGLFTVSLDGARFVLRDKILLTNEYDEIVLWQQFSPQPDTAYIMITFDDKVLNLPPDKINILHEILSPEEDFSVDIAYHYGEDKYIAAPVYPSMGYFIRKRFTPEQQLAQIRYIINQNEYQVLRSVEPDRLQENIDLFWESLAPHEDSVDNHYRDIFYSRVLHANRSFGVQGYLEGWQTDRGKVYIKYGQPDSITSDPFPMGSPPSIVWHYYSLNRSFYFYDMRGYGQYELREKWMD